VAVDRSWRWIAWLILGIGTRILARVRIASFLDLWLPSAVCFAITVLFGGSAALSRWVRRRATAPRA
jgi:hypothetical protein